MFAEIESSPPMSIIGSFEIGDNTITFIGGCSISLTFETPGEKREFLEVIDKLTSNQVDYEPDSYISIDDMESPKSDYLTPRVVIRHTQRYKVLQNKYAADDGVLKMVFRLTDEGGRLTIHIANPYYKKFREALLKEWQP